MVSQTGENSMVNISTRSHADTLREAAVTDTSLREFTPMTWSILQIKEAIPSRLFVRDTRRSVNVFLRDVAMAAIVWWLSTHIDYLYLALSQSQASEFSLIARPVKYFCWILYWWFQSLIFTGLWVIGHECGHGAFSSNQTLCDILGFTVHTFLYTPYFSWKISHHRHHCAHASMERDEVYVPHIRSELKIPADAGAFDLADIFGDTPIYTLGKLILQQMAGFMAYLCWNVSGQRTYPGWTSHFDPHSILFTKEQRYQVILSNIAIASMVLATYRACTTWGCISVLKYYGIPWLLVTHWFVMITYLHHTDMELPHYRKKQWTFARGAASTMDRDFLGWMGRFFLHDVAHYHVIHHFFPKMPWYHGEEATAYLKQFIGAQYRFSSKPAFQALWDTFNDCQFVDDEGDVVFYRDKRGHARLKASN